MRKTMLSIPIALATALLGWSAYAQPTKAAPDIYKIPQHKSAAPCERDRSAGSGEPCTKAQDKAEIKPSAKTPERVPDSEKIIQRPPNQLGLPNL